MLVVASEITKLANEVNSAIKEINNELSEYIFLYLKTLDDSELGLKLQTNNENLISEWKKYWKDNFEVTVISSSFDDGMAKVNAIFKVPVFLMS